MTKITSCPLGNTSGGGEWRSSGLEDVFLEEAGWVPATVQSCVGEIGWVAANISRGGGCEGIRADSCLCFHQYNGRKVQAEVKRMQVGEGGCNDEFLKI